MNKRGARSAGYWKVLFFFYFLYIIEFRSIYETLITEGGNMFKESINPCQVNVPSLYPLKWSKNLWLSDIFSGYRNGKLAKKLLKCSSLFTPCWQILV